MWLTNFVVNSELRLLMFNLKFGTAGYACSYILRCLIKSEIENITYTVARNMKFTLNIDLDISRGSATGERSER